MSDVTPKPAPPPPSAHTVLRIHEARSALATMLVEMGCSVEIGTSALASVLIDVLVVELEKGNPNVPDVMRRIGSRLQVLADTPPELVRASSRALADSTRKS